MARVFFCAQDVTVSGEAVVAGRESFAIRELTAVRARRIRRWFSESYEVVLTLRLQGEVALLRHRNPYFTFQLVRAIQAALDAQPADTREQALLA